MSIGYVGLCGVLKLAEVKMPWFTATSSYFVSNSLIILFLPISSLKVEEFFPKYDAVTTFAMWINNVFTLCSR